MRTDTQEKNTPRPSNPQRDYYERRARRWRMSVGVILLIVISCAWAQLLFRSAYFTVQVISIRGNAVVSSADIRLRTESALRQSKWGIFTEENIFLIDTTALRRALKGDVRIGKITIEKRIQKRQLIVTIEERVPKYIVETATDAYALDQEGVALLRLSLPAPKTLPLFSDANNSSRSIALQERVLSDAELTLIAWHDGTVSARAVHLGKPSPDAITIETTEGWGIYLTTTDDVHVQLERLSILLNGRLSKEKRGNLKYIDLRFGERVFYK